MSKSASVSTSRSLLESISSRIPTEILNYICEFAAGKKCKWYPFFCPKTGKLTWKLNIYSNKWYKYSKRFMKTVKVMNTTQSTAQIYLHNSQLLLFQCPIYYAIYPKYYYYTQYLVSKLHHDNNVYNMNVNIRDRYTYYFDPLQLYEFTDFLCENKEKYIYKNDVKYYKIEDGKVYQDRIVIYVTLL